MRHRTLSAVFCILTIAATAAPSAAAANTGGAAPASSTAPSTAPAAAAPAKPAIRLTPVTARTPRLTYTGPVYVKTATGSIVPYTSLAMAGAVNATGGAVVGALAPAGKPDLLVPGSRARYINGLAAAPMNAPAAVQQIIWAGNRIIGLPYLWGGGHASFVSPGGYDCSGTVSFALHGASLLSVAEDSSEFMGFGSHGAGRWIAIFANGGHVYMDVAGLRLDTSAADDRSNQQGPRWRPLRQGNEGFALRHPLGL